MFNKSLIAEFLNIATARINPIQSIVHYPTYSIYPTYPTYYYNTSWITSLKLSTLIYQIYENTTGTIEINKKCIYYKFD